MRSKVVVLDDDPTGCQTSHDVPVLLRWSDDDLAREWLAPERAVFLLTNSRALPAAEAADLARALGAQIRRVEERTGVRAEIVSRSDSTLRGHYPVETDALAEGYGRPFDATVLCPAFFPGGRTTVGGVHYVHGVPVAETEFARDRTFGYRNSDLRAWSRERGGDPDPVVVNAEWDEDLIPAVAACRAREARGERLLYRTAASWINAYAGIPLRPPRCPEFDGPALIVVGSYVGLSTRQAARVAERPDVETVPLGPDAPARLDAALAAGRHAMLLTDRDLTHAGDLAHGGEVSRRVVETVAALTVRAAILIAKGGITSLEVARDALGVRRAWVEGQAIPGVPVWRLGEETHWPGLTYLVFPGNVGEDGSLAGLLP